MNRRFGFGKKERLKSRRQIEELFLTGRRFVQFPLRIIYLIERAEEGEIKVGVAASKRNFKKAVARNRVKRLIRESYRLQKQSLLEQTKAKKLRLLIFFMYSGNTMPAYVEVSEAMFKALARLEKEIRSHEDPS